MSGYHDHLDAEIQRADRKIAETGARVAAHLGRRGQITGRASSRDGSVTVVVRPGGGLVDVDLTGAAFRLEPEQLAAEIVAVARRATRAAGVRMHESVRPLVSPEVAASLAELGLSPGGPAEDHVDWADVIRRTR